MDTEQTKCRLSIMRQAKASYSARAFIVYIDGAKATEIRNGGVVSFLLDEGKHTISFGIGSSVKSSIYLSLSSGSEENIICYASGSSIVATTTPVDLCSSSAIISSGTPRSVGGGIGCLPTILIVVGLFLLFLSFGVIRVQVHPFVFFTSR